MIGEGKRADWCWRIAGAIHIHIDHVWRQGKGCSDDGKTDLVNGAVRLREDSLLAELRLREQTQLLVAHRYITRATPAPEVKTISPWVGGSFYPRGAKPAGLKLAR